MNRNKNQNLLIWFINLSKYFHKPRLMRSTNMNRQNIRKQLEIDEGVKYIIYKDTQGLETVGIGHLITSHDSEHGQPVGTEITEDRAYELFEKDLDIHIEECKILYDEFHEYPSEVQEILVNMTFNLGRSRLSKFIKFCAAIREHNWTEAAKEGRDSQWYNQVTNRAERLMSRLENV